VGVEVGVVEAPYRRIQAVGAEGVAVGVLLLTLNLWDLNLVACRPFVEVCRSPDREERPVWWVTLHQTWKEDFENLKILFKIEICKFVFTKAMQKQPSLKVPS
jgi:hypothetical protein